MKDARIESLPKSILEYNASKKCIKDFKFKENVKEIIEHFVSTLGKENHIDLSNFYKNTEDFNIVDKSACFHLDHGAKFSTVNKKKKGIVIRSKEIEETIYHELIHLATFVSWEDIEACGFRQLKYKSPRKSATIYDIGAGLTEGYTELLSNRHFKDRAVKESYLELVDFSRFIEVLVGKDEMESLFFKANLPGLVNKLQSYASLEQVIKLLKDIDFILNANYYGVVPVVLTKPVYARITKTLAGMLATKIEKEKVVDMTTLREARAMIYSLKNHVYRAQYGYYKASSRLKEQIDFTIEMENEGSVVRRKVS